MRRAILSALAALLAVIICGCNAGRFGAATDSERYWRLSGFEVKAPSGANWFRLETDEKYPNGIAFVKLEQTPTRLSPDSNDFTITKVAAYGAPFKGPPVRSDEMAHNALGMLLSQFAKKAGFVVQERHFDTSLGARCLNYQGKPERPEQNSKLGVIRADSVSGYLCLHPDYQNFVVGMHSMNGASVRMKPADRKQQTDHFFRSIRFTPRSLPPKPEEPSKDEGKFFRG